MLAFERAVLKVPESQIFQDQVWSALALSAEIWLFFSSSSRFRTVEVWFYEESLGLPYVLTWFGLGQL